MIRITNFKDKYSPITYDYRGITIAFGFEPYIEFLGNGERIETNLATWYVHTFKNKPTFSQFKSFVLSEINKLTDLQILNGFRWREMPIWLSVENQFNYKAAYDLAVQTNGASLPTVFKFGTTEEPIYHKFDTLEELQDFYIKAMTHINEQLAIGWAKKDAIDWSVYEKALKDI